jgi:hypothetical protein
MPGRLLILAVLVALCGCSDRGTSGSSTTAPTTQAASEEWHRYDDPRYTADERRAVRAATEAVLDPNRPRPDFDQAFRYSVSQYQGDWVVTVWHVFGFEDGKPQFVPGGYTDVILDKDYKVKSKMPGA